MATNAQSAWNSGCLWVPCLLDRSTTRWIHIGARATVGINTVVLVDVPGEATVMEQWLDEFAK
jgi:hypothetical protein